METSNGVDEMSNKEAGQMSQDPNKKMWQRCSCGCHGGYRGHFVLRMVAAIILMLFVFALGVMVGRLHSYGHSERGMMHGGYYRQGMPMMRNYPGGMMQNGTMPMSASTTPTTTK